MKDQNNTMISGQLNVQNALAYTPPFNFSLNQLRILPPESIEGRLYRVYFRDPTPDEFQEIRSSQLLVFQCDKKNKWIAHGDLASNKLIDIIPDFLRSFENRTRNNDFVEVSKDCNKKTMLELSIKCGSSSTLAILLASVIDNKTFIANIKKHLNSTYSAVNSLKEALMIIYHRLAGRLDNQLGPFSVIERDWIVGRLNEGITNCTQGVHDRTVEVVQSLSRPKTFKQLMVVVRESLVEQIGIMTISEVHARNTMFADANKMGFGVRQRNTDHSYYGDLKPSQISDALQNGFKTHYTPMNIPALVEKQLRKEVVDIYSGYLGCGSYTDGDVRKVTELFNRYFFDAGERLQIEKSSMNKLQAKFDAKNRLLRINRANSNSLYKTVNALEAECAKNNSDESTRVADEIKDLTAKISLLQQIFRVGVESQRHAKKKLRSYKKSIDALEREAWKQEALIKNQKKDIYFVLKYFDEETKEDVNPEAVSSDDDRMILPRYADIDWIKVQRMIFTRLGDEGFFLQDLITPETILDLVFLDLHKSLRLDQHIGPVLAKSESFNANDTLLWVEFFNKASGNLKEKVFRHFNVREFFISRSIETLPRILRSNLPAEIIIENVKRRYKNFNATIIPIQGHTLEETLLTSLLSFIVDNFKMDDHKTAELYSLDVILLLINRSTNTLMIRDMFSLVLSSGDWCEKSVLEVFLFILDAASQAECDAGFDAKAKKNKVAKIFEIIQFVIKKLLSVSGESGQKYFITSLDVSLLIGSLFHLSQEHKHVANNILSLLISMFKNKVGEEVWLGKLISSFTRDQWYKNKLFKNGTVLLAQYFYHISQSNQAYIGKTLELISILFSAAKDDSDSINNLIKLFVESDEANKLQLSPFSLMVNVFNHISTCQLDSKSNEDRFLELFRLFFDLVSRDKLLLQNVMRRVLLPVSFSKQETVESGLVNVVRLLWDSLHDKETGNQLFELIFVELMEKPLPDLDLKSVLREVIFAEFYIKHQSLAYGYFVWLDLINLAFEKNNPSIAVRMLDVIFSVIDSFENDSVLMDKLIVLMCKAKSRSDGTVATGVSVLAKTMTLLGVYDTEVSNKIACFFKKIANVSQCKNHLHEHISLTFLQTVSLRGKGKTSLCDLWLEAVKNNFVTNSVRANVLMESFIDYFRIVLSNKKYSKKVINDLFSAENKADKSSFVTLTEIIFKTLSGLHLNSNIGNNFLVFLFEKIKTDKVSVKISNTCEIEGVNAENRSQGNLLFQLLEPFKVAITKNQNLARFYSKLFFDFFNILIDSNDPRAVIGQLVSVYKIQDKISVLEFLFELLYQSIDRNPEFAAEIIGHVASIFQQANNGDALDLIATHFMNKVGLTNALVKVGVAIDQFLASVGEKHCSQNGKLPRRFIVSDGLVDGYEKIVCSLFEELLPQSYSKFDFAFFSKIEVKRFSPVEVKNKINMFIDLAEKIPSRCLKEKSLIELLEIFQEPKNAGLKKRLHEYTSQNLVLGETGEKHVSTVMDYLVKKMFVKVSDQSDIIKSC